MLQTCMRCRSRRIKCDSLLPACANCAKADLECTFRDDALQEDIPRSYVKSLNDRIQELSSQLLLHQHNSERHSFGVDVEVPSGLSNESGQPYYILRPGTGQYHYLDRSPSSLMTRVAFEAVSHAQQTFNLVDFPENDSFTPESANADRSLLTPSTVRYLLGRYDRCILRHYDIPHPELSGQDGINIKKLSDVDRFKILMACAIAASRESYRSPNWKPLAQTCRDWANDSFMPVILAGDSESLTAVLLALIYELASPSRGIFWELSDLATRILLQLGFHRTTHIPESDRVSLSSTRSINSVSDLRINQARLMSVITTIEGSLRMVFNRPSILSGIKIPACSDTDTIFQCYMQVSDEIYGSGQMYAGQSCPFVGQSAIMIDVLNTYSTPGSKQHPVISEAWLLFVPVCVKHKQCVYCFQEADDYDGKGMKALRHKVVDAASRLLISVYQAATARDDFIPPLVACSRAFIAGCALVTSISKQWTSPQLHVKDLMRCTEILALFAPHWKGGNIHLQVWNSLTDLLDTNLSRASKG